MAEMLSSVVIGEAVNKIISSFITKDEDRYNATESIERLEMAHIKMESVLHMADKWNITDATLLRWQNKLKRATQECDEALRRCKKRALDEEETRKWVSQSSFPKRIAHATKSFVSSVISSDSYESCSGSADVVQRFERFADGANEFLKFIEFGGTPRKYMFFDPLIGHLLSGMSTRYQGVQESKLYYFGIRPMSFAERGVEAMVSFLFQDFKEPTKGFYLGFMLRLSECTDIFGVIIKCMESVTPHYNFAAESVRRGLIQLPTQDFSWLPYALYSKNKYWENIHNILTQWYRPNPLCCNEHKHNLTTSSSSTGNTTRLVSSMFPEEVIVILLQCHVSLSNYQCKSSHLTLVAQHGGFSSLTKLDVPALKLGVLIMPHDSPKDIDPAAESYALEVIDEKEGMTHTNACLQDLDGKLLPKAIDYLHQNYESKTYQMCLKSRHGTAHLCVEKMSAQLRRVVCSSKCKTRRQAGNKWVIRQHESVGIWKELSQDFLKFWVVRASDKLQGLFRSWTGNT
ncbi:hypothetical protein HU200_038285 [Digitaria exilis]|uniref:Uncharacterized protein n=1 Tax=Digitaria exilis TaxID=1010633 RepID=A0A835BCM2_9POAL|nr:hypothetical protein HU200_038285 [Digitaria exilis]